MDRIVIDKTGITGIFNSRLQFVAESFAATDVTAQKPTYGTFNRYVKLPRSQLLFIKKA
jgi:hypothetical protein